MTHIAETLDVAQSRQAERRQRLVNWTDPAQVIDRVRAVSGLEAVRRMADSELPIAPMAELMDIRALAVDPGRVVITARPDELFSNGMGAAHGGYTATLLDSAAWLALHTRCHRGQFCSTLQLNIHYMRSFPLGTGDVTCEGTVLHFSSSTATAEATMIDADGRRLAHATTHCIVRSAARRA
ncbi:MAG: PaaI family thioesterase [Microbacterium gubbeenense]|uniref:PaaI family thioesterase n=2 Tax=Microbacterium gubbeenense TaxID=159896 RepID=UPI000424461F|nr:PaaI family thioesterase [Microbacterium gubbeenense]